MRVEGLMIVGLAALCLAACGKTEAPGAATAAATGATSLPSAGLPRIVSLVPAATLNLVLIGGAERLVGVTKYDEIYLPEGERGLPVVGDYESINYEKLVGVHPTVVVMQMDEGMVPEKLRQLAARGGEDHFDVVNIKMNTLDDLWKTVGVLGRVSGREVAATTAVMLARAELKEIGEEMKGQARPRVVYAISRSPMEIAGAGTFMDQMVTLAGGDNMGGGVGRLFPVISNETLVKLSPEVLLVSAPDEPEQVENDPRVEPWLRFQVPAVWNDRVFLVTDGGSLMASVELPKQVRMLAKLIHKNAPVSASRLENIPTTGAAR